MTVFIMSTTGAGEYKVLAAFDCWLALGEKVSLRVVRPGWPCGADFRNQLSVQLARPRLPARFGCQASSCIRKNK